MTDARRLLVVGGGIGGYTAAIRAARHGLAVTLVEQDRLGGTCLNVGCIPSKSLLHQARAFRDAAAHADAARGAPAPDLASIRRERDAVVRRLVDGVGTLVARNRVTRVDGTASFVDGRRVRVTGCEAPIEFDACVIATGSRAARPPIPGIGLDGVIDSDAAVALAAVPRRLAVVGGGVVGVELAQVYADLGARVTIVERLERLIAGEDPDVSDVLRAGLAARGVDVRLGVEIEAIVGADGALELRLASGKVGADAVLVATGRVPRIDGLGLDAAGVRVERGAIVTDARRRTSAPGIWAVGDVRGDAMLAHEAAADAECAIADLLGLRSCRAAQVIPRAVYTSPAVAAVGFTEAQAREACAELRIGRFPLSANGKALADGAPDGFVKVLADGADGRIVGVSMVGAGVTELLGEATLAVQMELTAQALAETVHAHPTLSEALAEAAHDAHDGGAIHLPPRGAGARPATRPNATRTRSPA